MSKSADVGLMGVIAGYGGSGEADVQDEVSEPQAECSATGPVHDERQQDDGHDDDDHPKEEHDDAGNGIPSYCPRSSHGRQLPTSAGFIRRGSTGLIANVPPEAKRIGIAAEAISRGSAGGHDGVSDSDPRTLAEYVRHCPKIVMR